MGRFRFKTFEDLILPGSFIIVAIDTKESGIAKIAGTHLEIIPNIYSGQSGKYYTHAAKNNPNIEVFFEEIYHSLTIYCMKMETID